MVHFMQRPQAKVVIGASGTAFINRKTTKIEVINVENGFPVANVTITDKDIVEAAHMAVGGDFDIYVKDAAESTWFQMFDGKIRQATEVLGKEGETVLLKGDGSGWGLAETIVHEEYGSQSRRSTCDSIQDIITNASYGIVPAWVNRILGDTSKASGHMYNSDHVANVGGAIKYVYFGGKPASKSICDLIDLGSASVGAGAAGPHFIVLSGDILCVDTVGSHSAGSAGHGWSNYICGDSAASPLSTLIQSNRLVKGHFHNFKFQKLDQYANYILYYSPCIHPIDQDLWTENNAGSWEDWHYDYDPDIFVLQDDATYFQLGTHSIKCTAQLQSPPCTGWFGYPNSQDLALDLTVLGGRYSIPTLNLWVMRGAGWDTDAPLGIYLCTSTGSLPPASPDILDDSFYAQANVGTTTNVWNSISLPVGPYWKYGNRGGFLDSKWGFGPRWVTYGNADWAEINCIIFAFDCDAQPAYCYIDGLHFAGWILRGAKDGTSITANKLRTRLINDPFAKSDSLVASDDSGIAAQFAKAELLRARTTPKLGTFQTRMVRNAYPGQLLHVHARPNWNASTYNVNSDFRLSKITQLLDGSGGGVSTFEVTDDVYNAKTREAYTAWNTILQAIRPESQDRQSTGTKLRDIDVTQVILEKDYFP